MIKEDYCSNEIAKLLEEKRFPMGEHLFMHVNKDNVFMTDDYACLKLPWEEYKNFDEVYIPTITHQMAMKWLREVHKIDISICVSGGAIGWWYHIWEIPTLENKLSHRLLRRGEGYPYLSYEEAVEAALKYSLENLI